MCYMPTVLCFQCRRKSIHDNNLQTYGKVSSSGLHSGQEGNKQKTRALRDEQKKQANLCYTGDPSKRIAGSTRTANGRVCIISTNCNNTVALNNHIRQMLFTTLQQRSCSKSMFHCKTVQQLTGFSSVFIIFCVLKFYFD